MILKKIVRAQHPTQRNRVIDTFDLSRGKIFYVKVIDVVESDEGRPRPYYVGNLSRPVGAFRVTTRPRGGEVNQGEEGDQEDPAVQRVIIRQQEEQPVPSARRGSP